MAQESKPELSDDSHFYYRARKADREHTSTGFLLFVMGVFLAWIPYAQYLGDILLLIGIWMIYKGRNGFSWKHERNVNIAIALIVIMMLISFFVAVFLVSTIASIPSGATTLKQALQQLSATFNAFLGFVLVTSIIIGIGYFLMPYALVDGNGRFLLKVWFIIMVIFSIIIFLLAYSAISNLISNAGSTSFAAVAANTYYKVTIYGMLSAIPDIFLGVIYLYARSRIVWGTV